MHLKGCDKLLVNKLLLRNGTENVQKHKMNCQFTGNLYNNGRLGMIVNETAIHPRKNKLTSTGQITAFNNGPYRKASCKRPQKI